MRTTNSTPSPVAISTRPPSRWPRRAAVDRATAYGVACELIRGDDLDDDSGSPCDAEHLYEALVWLPGEGCEELACPVHAAVAVRTIPGATSRPNPNARYGDNSTGGPHP